MPGFITSSRGQIIRITQKPTYSSEDFENNLEELIQKIKEGPAGILTDARIGPNPPVSDRLKFIRKISENESLFERNCKGWALLVGGRTSRIVHVAIDWLLPGVFARKIFTNEEDALAWLYEHMKEDSGGGNP